MGQEGTLGSPSGEDIAILSGSEAMVVCTGVVELGMETNEQYIVWK